MDQSIAKALNDKLYDKRKLGALELERLIRDCLTSRNFDRIRKIIDQLCNDFAYAIHQPYARNGGLIGLAAASIALGPDVAPYLEKIIPPVLACFVDQDARVRYYACESMYNIAKTSKGEILPYFNEIFDSLAKLAADPESSVKNGAELLDRLIKDIISDSATAYVSILHEHKETGSDVGEVDDTPISAFSLPRFIPLLKERIWVINPFTRMFLVSWISLLDSIPDLELISYLPEFLGGLFRFLTDSNQDVVTKAQRVLEKFLDEIRLVARVSRELAENSKVSRDIIDNVQPSAAAATGHEPSKTIADEELQQLDEALSRHSQDSSIVNVEWIPGQDTRVDHPKILDILLGQLRDAKEEHIQLTALRWTDSFFDVCPEEILSFIPRLLNRVLPCLSSDIEAVRQAGHRVNESLRSYYTTYAEEDDRRVASSSVSHRLHNDQARSSQDKVDETSKPRHAPGPSIPGGTDTDIILGDPGPAEVETSAQSDILHKASVLDYEASVNALTVQFLHESEATRVAALSWLILLQSKAPKKILAAQDATFPALLKTLSDTSDAVVTRDLQLLSQISKNSDDSYFSFFIDHLLRLFDQDRRLLEARGNLIMRQLCINLNPERIYRTMADCLEKHSDAEFANIMVQYLNNNLITAPEMSDLRRKLRNWDTRDGQALFVVLFRSWCYNAVATISLCLLAQAYEQAYSILQIFADIEMTVGMLIQIDKLVQLLESPVFTFLRLQLLEPERHPFLYKCLYGILMLLPQSAAFAALKNRLNSVSAIGYLHVPTAARVPAGSGAVSTFDRANRLKMREDSSVKWNELFEKFRAVQNRAGRVDGRRLTLAEDGVDDAAGLNQYTPNKDSRSLGSGVEGVRSRPASVNDFSRAANSAASSQTPNTAKDQLQKPRLSMTGHLNRLATGVKGKNRK